MAPKKHNKRFIDKNKDVLHTFKVLSRSQRDPLAADENAPQAVLQLKDEEESAELKTYGVYFDDDYNYLQHLRGTREAINWEDEELEVYTIRKEDPQAGKKDLRNMKLLLPSSAFESFVEEPIGLLNKAAPVTGPRPELDPDVVAEMDDEFEFEEGAVNPEDDSALPDNFVLMLNSDKPITDLFDQELEDVDEDGGWEDCDEDEEWEDCDDELELEGTSVDKRYEKNPVSGHKTLENGSENAYSSNFNDSSDENESRDEVTSMDEPFKHFREEETKSHFTNYSLTSSVLRRTEMLTVLDDCFEEKIKREYNDDQLGALDGEDIDGFAGENSILFQQAVSHSRKQLSNDREELQDQKRIINWIKNMQKGKEGKLDMEEKEVVQIQDDDLEEKWDCETILSTYSNIYNHPHVIKEIPQKKISINHKRGFPLDDSRKGLTKKVLAQHDGVEQSKRSQNMETATLLTYMSAISIRPPNETPEERHARKQALKELRRERRIEKKLNKEAFKLEKKKQERNMMNNSNSKKLVKVV